MRWRAWPAPWPSSTARNHRRSAGSQRPRPLPLHARGPDSARRRRASFDLVKYASDYSRAQAILLDAHVEAYGGGGKAFDWSLLPPAVDAHLVLSGGPAPANVGDGIPQLRTRCKSLSVDVSSGVEAAKGLKDAEKIRDSWPPCGRPMPPRLAPHRARAAHEADHGNLPATRRQRPFRQLRRHFRERDADPRDQRTARRLRPLQGRPRIPRRIPLRARPISSAGPRPIYHAARTSRETGRRPDLPQARRPATPARTKSTTRSARRCSRSAWASRA